MLDHYRTLAASAEFRHKIERSEFMGIAFPATTDDSFFEQLTAIQKRTFDATHHCWAYRLFAGGEGRSRSADAGEPSGTAGKPILNAIESAGLFDAGVVVVRWFGGVKLGTGGLSRAYRQTAAETLRETRTAERYLYTRFIVSAPFDALGQVYRMVAPPAVVLTAERFGETNEFDFDVRRGHAEEFGRALRERRLQFRTESS